MGAVAIAVGGGLLPLLAVEDLERFFAQLGVDRGEVLVGELADRVVDVLVERDDDGELTGRAAHQAPEVDGECVLERGSGLEPGDLVRCVVADTEGADLLVARREVLPRRTTALVGAGSS